MKRSPVTRAELPPGVVTMTGAVPAEPDGEVTAHVVAELQTTAVAPVSPNLAVVVTDPMMKLVPVTVTTVPPAKGPAIGVMAETVGAAS